MDAFEMLTIRFHIHVFLILLPLVGMGQDFIVKADGEVLEVQYLDRLSARMNLIGCFFLDNFVILYSFRK